MQYAYIQQPMRRLEFWWVSEWVREPVCYWHRLKPETLPHLKSTSYFHSRFVHQIYHCALHCRRAEGSGSQTTRMLLLYEWRLYKEEWGFSAFVARFQKSVQASWWIKLTRDNSLDTVHSSVIRMFHWYLQSSRLLTSWPRRPCPVSTGVLL